MVYGYYKMIEAAQISIRKKESLPRSNSNTILRNQQAAISGNSVFFARKTHYTACMLYPEDLEVMQTI